MAEAWWVPEYQKMNDEEDKIDSLRVWSGRYEGGAITEERGEVRNLAGGSGVGPGASHRGRMMTGPCSRWGRGEGR